MEHMLTAEFINEHGLTIIIVGAWICIMGIVGLIPVMWHNYRYKAVTATIFSSKKYTMSNALYPDRYRAMLLDYVVDNISYRIRQDISTENRNASKLDKYAMGNQIKIYYRTKKPEKIDMDLNNNQGKMRRVAPIFLCIGMIVLSIGIYLNWYYTPVIDNIVK